MNMSMVYKETMELYDKIRVDDLHLKNIGDIARISASIQQKSSSLSDIDFKIGESGTITYRLPAYKSSDRGLGKILDGWYSKVSEILGDAGYVEVDPDIQTGGRVELDIHVNDVNDKRVIKALEYVEKRIRQYEKRFLVPTTFDKEDGSLVKVRPGSTEKDIGRILDDKKEWYD